MAKKDKFAQMQQSGGASSFQETLVQAATTVAAIEKQQEEQSQEKPSAAIPSVKPVTQRAPGELQTIEQPKFTRLPNPQIPYAEYNLVTRYCEQFPNMTRQDFVELAIIEKLHADAGMTDEDFKTRYEEIRSRPTRGQRKGTKTQTIK